MPNNTAKTELLLQKAQTGDRLALGEIFDELSPKLFGYLVNTTRDRSLSEDIFQTTWLKAIKALPRFQSQGQGISAWLFAIARNELKQHWRQSKQEIFFDPQQHDQIDTTHDNVREKILVEQILTQLPEAERELLRLRYLADLSPAEIARVLNINHITVRVRLHRVLASARTLLINKDHD